MSSVAVHRAGQKFEWRRGLKIALRNEEVESRPRREFARPMRVMVGTKAGQAPRPPNSTPGGSRPAKPSLLSRVSHRRGNAHPDDGDVAGTITEEVLSFAFTV